MCKLCHKTHVFLIILAVIVPCHCEYLRCRDTLQSIHDRNYKKWRNLKNFTLLPFMLDHSIPITHNCLVMIKNPPGRQNLQPYETPWLCGHAKVGLYILPIVVTISKKITLLPFPVDHSLLTPLLLPVYLPPFESDGF